MSSYLSHIYSKEPEKDSSKRKEDEANQPGRSSQPKDQSSMPKPTKKPKDLDKWAPKNAKADGKSAIPKRPPPAGKSAGATTRAKSPPLPPKDLKPKMGKKALENSDEEGVGHDKPKKKKPRQEFVAPVNEGTVPPKPRKDAKGRLDTAANDKQETSRPKDKDTAKSKEPSVPESPEAAESGSEDIDPLNRHTKHPFELTSQDADIAARYRQRLQALCRTIDDDFTPPDPDRSKDEEDDELLGVFKGVSDQVEEVRKWMRMVGMDWAAFEKLQERAEREGMEGAEGEGDVEESEVLDEVEAGDRVEVGRREDEDVGVSGGLERLEEEKTDKLDVVAERERQVSDQVQRGETPGYRSSPSQSPPHLPSDDEPYRTEPQGPAATESNLLMDEEQDLSDRVQRGETPGYLSSSSQSPAQLPSDDESQQGSSEQFQGRETPDNLSSPSRSSAQLPSDDESRQGSLDRLEEIPEYLLNPLEGSYQPPPSNEVGSTRPQGGAAPQGVLSSILRSLQHHADEMSRNDPHASSAGRAGHNDGRAAGTVDQAPEALEQETRSSQASVGNRPQDTLDVAATGTDSGNERDEVDDLFNEDVMGPVEVSPEIEASLRFETTAELPRSDVSVLDGNEGTFEPHARPPNTSLPGLGLYLPSMTTAAGSSVETSGGPSATLPGLNSGQGLDAPTQHGTSTSGTAENGSQHAEDSQSPVAANSVVADGSIGTEHERSEAGQFSPSRATKRKSTSEDEESPRKKSRSNSPTEPQFR
ncbi:hypothetical protein KC340_g8767 [Hortaea werneckii]|nr:hypothetical protein KC342_g8733 [Hortaea werneckii]KAI7100025.1 hypothetical protein KC339_g7785 [Hortaea werneckii]KAI7235035.1 hypothetical protein KC365_g5730 [Hortaea werneckii]KAI7315999.1 hypothetical protein KC340_g8767 [Hortaea werneckii]KAI7381650.1 hypothetical protein KC328_g12105 [Hortaea werneckii]